MSVSETLFCLPETNAHWNLAQTFKQQAAQAVVSPYGKKKAVVIGGGTGAPVSIRVLLALGFETSAVIAMADDGGSTGLLRERVGAIPPGDIRKCLVAMAHDSDDPFVRAFKMRFDYAQNHTLGNLMLTALSETSHSFPEAIHICERMLGARGHVYPSTLDPITLAGHTRDGRELTGQTTISRSTTALSTVSLIPDNPTGYEPALDALRKADLIILGPGSVFTSIIPNLLVQGVADAVRESGARTLLLCPVADMQGETEGLRAIEIVNAVRAHGMDKLLDAVCIQVEDGAKMRRFPIDHADLAAIGRDIPQVVVRQMTDTVYPTWHNPHMLGEIVEEVMSTCLSRQR